MPRPFLFRHPSLLLALAAATAGWTGCELRDEEPPRPTAADWAPAAAERLATVIRSRDQLPQATDRLECVEGFAAGSRRAADAGLPLLLIFRAAWCPWSDEFATMAAADAALLAAADRFVCASVDADRDAAVCRSFGVRAFPTVIALDAARRERFRATGAAARERLSAAVAALVAEPPPRVAGDPPVNLR
ncbi:MAG: hypothetical protein RLZZ440_1065 [Planctomycetota bacterium]|jgi:hypothetical protein